MHRNGHGQKLRVLMTGNEAEQLAPTIGAEPTVALIGPVRAEANVDLAPADVLLHVVASSSAPELPNEVAELDGLRRALGLSTFTALQALLPFSRNDLWEVAELKQRVNRR